MGRIDCRTPGRRRAERCMWVALYVLIIGCGALLGYLGFGNPEKLFAEDADRSSPAPAAPTQAAPTTSPRPAPSTEPKSPAPATAEPAAFFGIPVESPPPQAEP